MGKKKKNKVMGSKDKKNVKNKGYGKIKNGKKK